MTDGAPPNISFSGATFSQGSLTINTSSNIEYNIYDVTLMGILPKGVNFVSTSVEHGQYKYCKDDPNKIFYYISIIKAHSFCKIVLYAYPTIMGNEMKPIEIF